MEEERDDREIIIESVKPTKDEVDRARAILKKNASLTVRGDGFDIGERASGTSIEPYHPGEPQDIRIRPLTTRDLPEPGEFEKSDVEAAVGGIIYAFGTRLLSPYAKTTTQRTILGLGAGAAAGFITAKLTEGRRGKNVQRKRYKQDGG